MLCYPITFILVVVVAWFIASSDEVSPQQDSQSRVLVLNHEMPQESCLLILFLSLRDGSGERIFLALFLPLSFSFSPLKISKTSGISLLLIVVISEKPSWLPSRLAIMHSALHPKII